MSTISWADDLIDECSCSMLGFQPNNTQSVSCFLIYVGYALVLMYLTLTLIPISR
jgi:hypothetical protein